MNKEIELKPLDRIIKQVFQGAWEDKYGVDRMNPDKFELDKNGKLRNYDMQIAFEFFYKGYRAGRGDAR